MKYLSLLLFCCSFDVCAQSVQLELNPAIGKTTAVVAKGPGVKTRSAFFSGGLPPVPTTISLAVALNFQLRSLHFFPSAGARMGTYAVLISGFNGPGYAQPKETFDIFGFPLAMNYIQPFTGNFALRASAGVEPLYSVNNARWHYAADMVAGFMLFNKLSVGLKFYKPFSLYKGRQHKDAQYELYSWMLDFKFRKGW